MKKNRGWLDQLSKLERFLNARFSIDVGSRYTRVVYKSKLIWHQPTCVTFHTPTQTVVEIGQKAWLAMGKTPNHMETLFPIRNGKVSEIQITLQYLRALQKMVLEQLELPFVLNISGVIGVSSSLSPVEIQTWKNVLHEGGFQRLRLVKKSQAIYTHARAQGKEVAWVLDVGDQTTEIGAFVGEELVSSKSIDFGGQQFTLELQDLLRSQYQAVLSQAAAEAVKTQQRTLRLALDQGASKAAKSTIRASDVITHEPKVVYLERRQLEERFAALAGELLPVLQQFLANLSSETSRALMEQGLYLTGGGSLVSGLSEYLQTNLQTRCLLAEQPELDVVWGLAETDK